MAILRGGGSGGRELRAPDGLDLAGPARDERSRVVVEVRAEIRTALCRGDRVEARTSRPHHGGPLPRPSRGIRQQRPDFASLCPTVRIERADSASVASAARKRRYPPQSGNRRSCSTRRAPGAYAVLK